ncbi:hypothetical protein SAMN02745830_07113 [Streptomyces sp. Amel2xC10]|nr:hypothetical protein SAMN02745830_07113 [Streptomyces sp. Amel2xC10]
MTSEEYIRRLVDDWPPLSAAQRDRLRALLRPQPGQRNRPAKAA